MYIPPGGRPLRIPSVALLIASSFAFSAIVLPDHSVMPNTSLLVAHVEFHPVCALRMLSTVNKLKGVWWIMEVVLILFPASAHPRSQSSSYESFESYAASPVTLSAGLWAAEWRRWSSKGRIADWDCWQAIFPRQGGEGEAPLGARCLWWWNENVLLVSFLVEKRLINNLVLIMLDFDW